MNSQRVPVGHSRAASVVAFRASLQEALGSFRSQHYSLVESFATTSRSLHEAAESVAHRQLELTRQVAALQAQEPPAATFVDDNQEQRILELEAEIAKLQQLLDETRDQAAAVEAEYAKAEQRIAEQTAELEQVRSESASAADAALCVELAALEERCEALTAERDEAVLQAEEATHSFLQYKQQADHQRTEQAAELRALRRVLEMQMHQWSPGGETSPARLIPKPVASARNPAAQNPAASREKKASPSASNPVVGSVMAQFEQLQQQRFKQALPKK